MAFEEEKKSEEPEMIVVTGYKRSGTSLMMALVEKLGIELHYCPDFEAALRAHHGGKNDFYYEDAKLSSKKAPEGETVWFDGAVKIFSHVVTHNVKQAPPHLQSNVKVIWMKRDPAKIERSIRRYKKPNTAYFGPGGVSSSTLEDELEIIGKLEDLHGEAQRELSHLLTIDFDELLKDPVEVAKLVSEFIGRPFDMKVVEEYLKVVNRDKMEDSITNAPAKKSKATFAKEEPLSAMPKKYWFPVVA